MADRRIYFNTGRAVRELMSGIPATTVFEPVFRGGPIPQLALNDLALFRVQPGLSQSPTKAIVGTLSTAASLDISILVEKEPSKHTTGIKYVLNEEVNPSLVDSDLTPHLHRVVEGIGPLSLQFASGATPRPHFDLVFQSLGSIMLPTNEEAASIIGAKLKTNADTLSLFVVDYQPFLADVYRERHGNFPTLDELLKFVSSSTELFSLPSSKDILFMALGYSKTLVSKPGILDYQRVYRRDRFTIDRKNKHKVIPLPKYRAAMHNVDMAQLEDFPYYVTGCPVRRGLTYKEAEKNEPSLFEVVTQKYVEEVRQNAAWSNT